ncbi:MAG: hydrolase family protein, partial [Acidobacteria bacterium]|nr:hydrolase family protein [Acidobacteriota bacterium]
SVERVVDILALGDSYTIGESVAEGERWPVLLAAALRAGGQPVAEPRIIARTGWTTDELAQAIAAAKPGSDYDLVTLLIGVNDQYRGRSINDYPERFSALLAQAIGFAGGRPGRVLVLSIPDWGATPYATGRDRAKIAAEIDAYNALNRAATEAAGARYVDVTPVSREAATDAGLLAPDGLHPSGAMYARWVELAVPAARAALADQPATRPAAADPGGQP